MADSNEQPPAKKSRHESPKEDDAPTLKAQPSSVEKEDVVNSTTATNGSPLKIKSTDKDNVDPEIDSTTNGDKSQSDEEEKELEEEKEKEEEEEKAEDEDDDEDEGDKDGGNKDEDGDKDEDEGDDNNSKSDDDVDKSDEDEPRSDDEPKSDEKSEEDKERTAFDTDDDDGTLSSDEDADLIESRSKKEIPLEAFNMDEEKDLGKFDKDGHFVWNSKTREPTDAWLEGEGSKPVLVNARAINRCQKIRMKEVEDDDTPTDDVLKQRLIVIENLMEDNETVQGTIARLQLTRVDKNSSASERLAIKKAGGSYSSPSSSKDCKENPLPKLLDAVDEFPVRSDIFSLTKSEITAIIASPDEFEQFKRKAYPLLIDITSEGSVDSENGGKKSPIMVSSDEEDDVVEEEGSGNGIVVLERDEMDDDDDQVEGKEAAKDKEPMDMFAD